MKYICQICGYIYDEEKEKIPFSELPDSWTCPLCGAKKSDFKPEETKEEIKNSKVFEYNDDMLKLSSGQLSALFSNLARGAQKQYNPNAEKEFDILAKWFFNAVKDSKNANISDIENALSEDIKDGYDNIRLAEKDNNDRGALRVTVWGEKVSRILNTLLERYKTEGDSFLKDTEIWVCTTCGFVYVGKEPPEVCPVCKVQDWKFEKVYAG